MRYFTASNGVAISMSPGGYLAVTPKEDTSGDATALLLPVHTEAIREFFRDEERELFPFPPVPGVAREPLPVMTRRTLWERILDRINPAPYKPARHARKDGIR